MKLITLLLLSPYFVFSQQVLSLGGGVASSNNETTVSFTIGETVIAMGVDSKIVTQGFQQPVVNEIKKELFNNSVNAFSPNGDGNNDTWTFKSNDNDYIIEIFSRWGNVVWENKENPALNKWDGKNKNDVDVPTGTYFYTINANGTSENKGSGYIEITR